MCRVANVYLEVKRVLWKWSVDLYAQLVRCCPWQFLECMRRQPLWLVMEKKNNFALLLLLYTSDLVRVCLVWVLVFVGVQEIFWEEMFYMVVVMKLKVYIFSKLIRRRESRKSKIFSRGKWRKKNMVVQ